MGLAMLARRALLGGLAAVAALAVDPARAAEGKPGSLVIVGGALRFSDPVVWTRMVELAGGPGAKVAVMPTASGNPKKNGGLVVDAFKKYGADPVLIPLSLNPKRMDDLDYKEVRKDPKWVEAVKGAGLVYFIGGTQERIVTALFEDDGNRSPMLQAVFDVHEQGGAVGGSSAGAAIMSDPMFRDAQNVFQVLRNGARFWDVLKGDPPAGEETTRGLGLMRPNWFVDQHFLTRGRLARTLVVMRDRGFDYGLGVDENTAVVVTGGKDAEVIGYKGAMIVDLSQASFDADQPLLNLTNGKLSYLDRGDKIDLETLEVTPSPEKAGDLRVDPNAADFDPYFTDDEWHANVLGNTTVVDLMSNLIDNEQKEVIALAFTGNPVIDHQDTGWEFKFYKGPDSIGYYTGAFGGEDYSVYNVHLDVRPIEMAAPLYQAVE